MPTIKIKSGLETNRLSITPVEGELLFTSDDKKLYIGDGSTAGGNPINLTALEILNLIKTLDGSSSTLSGQFLDGIDEFRFLRNFEDGSVFAELTVNDEILIALNVIANSNSVVDVFIYDTSKDSDGGQWIEKTSNNFWYNETLNTATRGNTKEFPLKALIIAELDKITIYDATLSTIPMWMVFNGNSSFSSLSTVVLGRLGGGVGKISSVKMLNGKLCVCGNQGATNFIESFIRIDFISERVDAFPQTSYFKQVFNNLADRNTITQWELSTDFTGLIGFNCNDVDMVVLDNAPIDPETNLPIPTIAIATTNNGASIINDNGLIADMSFSSQNGNKVFKIGIDKKYVYPMLGSSDNFPYVIFIEKIPFDDIVINNTNRIGIQTDDVALIHSQDANTATNFLNDNINTSVTGGTRGLTLIDYNYDIKANSMVNYIDHEYHSGWLYGDIKGAFLANSKTLDRSANNNSLVENGTVTESPVNTGSELNAYSGFTTSNYLEQAYNSDLDFGTGDFHIMGWLKPGVASANNFLFEHNGIGTSFNGFINASNNLFLRIGGSTIGSHVLSLNRYVFWVLTRINGIASMYIDGELINSVDNTAVIPISGTNTLVIGARADKTLPLLTGSMSLLRIGAGSPSKEKIIKIYQLEKQLFNENVACTLSGTSPVVQSLSYDDDTNILHVGTDQERSEFNNLVRVNEEVGSFTSLSSNNSIIATGN